MIGLCILGVCLAGIVACLIGMTCTPHAYKPDAKHPEPEWWL